MSALEQARWVVFEGEFGPLTIQERIDALAAQVAYAIHASAGGKGQVADFMPRWRRTAKGDITDWLDAMAKH